MNGSDYFPSVYEQYIYKSRYARFLPEKNRREHWPETVERYLSYVSGHVEKECGYKIEDKLYEELKQAILHMEVLPSMRALMTAGKALELENTAAYNCSYLPVDDPKSFDEAMYILMCGTGVGFSVERQYVNQLPDIPDQLFPSDTIIHVKDSRAGWTKAFRMLLALLYSGEVPKWDLSKVRPAGAPLRTFGGRASGGNALVDLFQFTVGLFHNGVGRKLTSLECHDLMCKIAEVVICGGVRRCVVYNARVQLSAGYKEIQYIDVGDEIMVGGEVKKVTDKVYSGKQEIIQFKHRFGKLECTKNHRVAVWTDIGVYDFKPAEELKIGDRLVWDACGIEGLPQKLPADTSNQVKRYNTKLYYIPENLTPDVAWLLGVVHGDGHISNRELSIHKHIIPLLEKANKILTEKFGISGKIMDGHGTKRLRVSSKGLCDWFRNNIKQPKIPLRIPESIFTSSRDVRAAYLMGLFDTDGRTRNDGVIDQASTIYEQYKNDIVTLLASLGVGCRVDQRMNNHYRTFWNICINGNTNKKMWIGLAQESVSGKLDKIKHIQFKSSVDFTWPKHFHEQLQWKGGMTIGSAALNLNYNIDPRFLPTEIIAINNLPETDTYDIEVEGEQFVVDGLVVHNSAMISLSNLSDDRMRTAKTGKWWEQHSHRALSNNSAVYSERPDVGMFMKEWLSLYESKSGERGIFNREAALKQMGKVGRKIEGIEPGLNPCGEILLRAYEFCNLSEVVVRHDDTEESLNKKIRLATILGTFQSTFTHFPYLRKIWQKNTEEERLLGVSLTGIYDCKLMNNHKDKNLPGRLERLKQTAIDVNKELAKKLGISQSSSVTTIKPAGTTSQLTNTSSGIHQRHSEYYFRRIRADNKDPLCKYLIDAGIPSESDVTKINSTTVFTFPIKAPKSSVCRDDISALEHLELWLIYKSNWCTHNASCTISVKEDDWVAVGAWVWEHFDEVSGISFLPYDGGIYRQAPYEAITKEQYEEALSKMPVSINWDELVEREDLVEGAQLLACSAGCDV